MRYSVFAIIILLSLSLQAVADVSDCGNLQNNFGPIDYRTATASDKQLVERYHFTARVEHLKGGQSGQLAADLSYTLRVFPNHPRALWAMSKLAIREKTEKPAYSQYSTRCWFDRAIRFRPDDPNVRMIYGVYLTKNGRNREALEQLKVAAEYDKDNANLNYNIGLAYFELKQYEQALEFAHRAYRLGFSLPGLKSKLVQVGKWRDPFPGGESVESASTGAESPVATEPVMKER